MPPKSARAMTGLEWNLLLALSLLWGGSFFFVGVAVRELPPLTIVALRVGIAALILNLVLSTMGSGLPRDARVWRAFFGMGLLNNAVPFSLFVWGQTQIASGVAAILNATTPLFTVLLAHAATQDERLTAPRLGGVLAGFCGVAVMIGPTALAGSRTGILPELACLVAAFVYACAGVYGRRFARMGVPPLMTAAGQVTASTALLLLLALAADRPWTLAFPSSGTLAAILALAAFSTALGYVLYFRILATAGATNLLLVTFLIPVSAILLGALVLGERLEARHFGGMALIGLGLAAIDGRLLNLRGTPRAEPLRRRGGGAG